MLKLFLKRLGFAILLLNLIHFTASAQSSTAEAEPKTPAEATMKSRCEQHEALGFPACATTPAECGSVFSTIDVSGGENGITRQNLARTPFNCIFLQEPIGGKPGYDLYVGRPHDSGVTMYTLWYGEAIVGNEVGPFQAILTYEEGKETQGPFGLLYNYLRLVYDFVSGIIIGFVILIVIIGGIRMSASRGDETAYSAGKNMIYKALVGMVLWFTASVILYTINPTFFAF